MKISFIQEALDETTAAFEYYNNKRPGLGSGSKHDKYLYQ